jgi:hypothetical protein
MFVLSFDVGIGSYMFRLALAHQGVRLTPACRGIRLGNSRTENLVMNKCLNILLVFALLSPSSVAQDRKTSPTPQPADAAPTTELKLFSTPDGADIEVDGAFVGNAPSTVTLATGDHTVRVTKKGYQPYQKKLRTSGGSVSLRADLEVMHSQPAVNENINANVNINAPKLSTVQTQCLIINREIEYGGFVWNQGKRHYMYVDSYNLSPQFVKTKYKANDVTEVIKNGVRVIVVNSPAEVRDARISCQGEVPQK